MLNLRVIVTAAVIALATSASAADIIVESRSGGQNFSGYSEVKGEWINSNTPAATSKSAAPGLAGNEIGSRKSITTYNAATPPDEVISSARFTPPIKEAGDYHVYVTFPRGANAAPVTVYVKSAKGEDRQALSMDGWGGISAPNGNQWHEIGTYPFTPNNDQYVEIQTTGATKPADARNAMQTYADAVRFSTTPISTKPKKVAATNASASSAAPVELTWKTSIGDARAEADKSGKKVFVFFYSPASSRSTDYNKNVLEDPVAKRAIAAGYVPVKINMDTERQLATQLGVFRAGTINIYDAATGANVLQISDTPAVDDLVQRLK